ncbi:hypothetical protein [Halobacillus sp. Marseille-Q1614]|uniref:hypothetical protein n=1 Tax=Halobacillus sp. Marseille-Q1614 TaxID=2709134 RepID=UPI00156F0D1F|nr:hypothetical protein [Halobacillus sp. Marseille-Q1614]
MFNFSFMDSLFQWFDPNLLQIFGLQAWQFLFALVFLLVAACMWVFRPFLEWAMAKNWSTLLSYLGSLLLAVVFLQFIDRYAMVNQQSVLPDYFWSISLLAISSYGAGIVLFRSFRKVTQKLFKRNKRKVA